MAGPQDIPQFGSVRSGVHRDSLNQAGSIPSFDGARTNSVGSGSKSFNGDRPVSSSASTNGGARLASVEIDDDQLGDH